ncbi:putative WRKY transcription factor 31 isoform X2 [Canna indica]|uniref:WRKY transcription factor 31 isoform X2 n=1 Tax=Canna indica TaxID=4628 RepID=A0AAQ3QH75_9LILI|nr:putative WRKY transcription factor 31 isoform X2 [Canna indica]
MGLFPTKRRRTARNAHFDLNLPPDSSSDDEEELPTTDDAPSPFTANVGAGGSHQSSSIQESNESQHEAGTGGGVGESSAGNNEISREWMMREHRVSVRTQIDDPVVIIVDGCKWKKYGEKTTKESSYPRSYYRCVTAAPGGLECPVRKQQQKSAEDKMTLVITYRGGPHNHPLPPAAATMESIASAAVRELLFSDESRSTSCGALVLDHPDFLARGISPVASLSASEPFPTVMLDLTQSTDGVRQRQMMAAPPAPFFGGGGGAGLAAPAPQQQVFGQVLSSPNDRPHITAGEIMAAAMENPEVVASFGAIFCRFMINRNQQAGSDAVNLREEEEEDRHDRDGNQS